MLGDIGCYGGLAPTPRIDALAEEGLRFKNYNPALLTGRLPIRTGNCSVPLPGQGHYGLAPWKYTLGELFSDAGYATAAFGKWHVDDIRGGCRLIKVSMNGLASKTPQTNRLTLRTHCLRNPAFPFPRFGKELKERKVTPVEDFNLETRPLLDEKIAARATALLTN